MDEFSVPMLTEGGFNSNSSNNNNSITHSHHLKDHMLSAGNTPATPFMYEMQNKLEMSSAKSDYAAFTNCIQQSTLLDHRNVDANMDGVLFSCSSSSINSVPSNFKNISQINIESTNTLARKSSPPMVLANQPYGMNSEYNIAVDPKDIQNSQVQPPHYMTLKPTESTSSNNRFIIESSSDNNDSKIKQDVKNSPNNSATETSNYLSRNGTNFPNLMVSPEGGTQNSNNSNLTENPIPTTTSLTSSPIKSTANKNITEHTTITNTKNQNTSNNSNTEELAASSCSASMPSTSHNTNNKLSQEEQNAASQTLSSDCETLSSSDEFIDMDMSVHNVYQDNTSSHSQQSASGGSGGGGGGGGGGNSGSSNIALLNGNNSAAAGGGYMALLPPAIGNASSSGGHLGGGGGPGTSHHGTSASAGGGNGEGGSGGGGGIDFKHLFEELCPVCGDKVSGYHYGLLTCESCKGFFKRTVQNKKVYTCVAERSCHIDKTQRKRCPYCRFQKCLEVGMKLEAVRADRMRGGRNKFGPMYKRDRARKLQVMRQRQLALQALRTSIGSVDMKPTPLSPGYQQAYPNMNIKQEIQIPQVSSLTQSPDSSPSPIAIALGQVNASAGVIATPMNGSSNAGGGGGNNSTGSNNSNNNTNSDSINRGGVTSNCNDTGTGSLQNSAESKMCFDSGTHPSSTADSIIEPLRVSPMIRDFVQSIDDREWQTQLFALLQKQTYNQVEVDLFELMCKVLDQNLFSQVDWARNTVFFKDLKVDDQMKLLQHSWSDMLVLDHLHQRIHNGLPDVTQLNNGQVFNLLWLGLLGVPQLSDYFNELQNKLTDLKFDMGDYVCMKFLILLNPDVRGILNKKTVLEGHENVQAALLDYTLTCYPSVTDKFRRLLNILPEIHAMAARGEEHLYTKHCAGSAPTQTLLMEMLHAKRKV